MFTHRVNVNKNFSQNRSVFSIKCSEDQGEYNAKKLDLLALRVHKVLRRKYIMLDLGKPGSINNTMIVNKSVAISYHMMSKICGVFVYMYMCVCVCTRVRVKPKDRPGSIWGHLVLKGNPDFCEV